MSDEPSKITDEQQQAIDLLHSSARHFEEAVKMCRLLNVGVFTCFQDNTDASYRKGITLLTPRTIIVED